jgi:hypothetical protein
LNDTFSGAGGGCPLNYQALCPSPIAVVATALFQGNFTAILNDPAKRKEFADAVALDVARAVRIEEVGIRRMSIAGSRRQARQTLIVEIAIPGVSANNAAFATAFAAFAANPAAALSSVSAAYSRFTGQTLTILRIGIGGGASAFSLIPVPTTGRPATVLSTARGGE